MRSHLLPAPAHEKRNLLTNLARVIFRPAVQLLLRHGISGLEIEEIVRWCCVDAALHEPEFAIPGRNVHAQTYSHAAILTGFTRVEVKRLADQKEPEIDAVTESASRLERALEVWRSDPRFQDEQGKPMTLPLRGPAPSLDVITRNVGRDTPVRAIADALVAAGNAAWEGKRLRFVDGVFVGPDHSPEDVALLTQIASDFMFSFQQSFDPKLGVRPRFREAFFRDIARVRVDELRSLLYERIAAFNADCLELLKGFRAVGDEDRVRIGVGAYSFIGTPTVEKD